MEDRSDLKAGERDKLRASNCAVLTRSLSATTNVSLTFKNIDFWSRASFEATVWEDWTWMILSSVEKSERKGWEDGSSAAKQMIRTLNHTPLLTDKYKR